MGTITKMKLQTMLVVFVGISLSSATKTAHRPTRPSSWSIPALVKAVGLGTLFLAKGAQAAGQNTFSEMMAGVYKQECEDAAYLTRSALIHPPAPKFCDGPKVNWKHPEVQLFDPNQQPTYELDKDEDLFAKDPFTFEDVEHTEPSDRCGNKCRRRRLLARLNRAM